MDDRTPDERLRETAIHVCGWMIGTVLRLRAGKPMHPVEDMARVAESLRRALADLGCPVGPPVWTPPEAAGAVPDTRSIDDEVS
jgi:hypothetical protein